MNLQQVGNRMNTKKQPVSDVEEPKTVKEPMVVHEGEDWKDKYIRAVADYQNLEKRSRDQVQEARLYASEIVMGRLFTCCGYVCKSTSTYKRCRI